MSLFTRAVVAATDNPLSRKLVKGTPPGRMLARRFVAGDSLTEAVSVAESLNRSGLTVSLDLLGEEVTDRETAESATEAYLGCIGAIEASGLDSNISIKLTQLGLAFDAGFAAEQLERLATAAKTAGTTVTVDMEDSRYTEQTVDIYAASQQAHGNLGICLQAYLFRTAEDLARLMPLGGHIRLCKGAYLEPSTVAYQSRAEVEASFARLLEQLMSTEGVKPAVATHDDALIELTRRLADRRSAPFEFQMLYGVRTSLQASLIEDGFPLRIYLPYGSEWYAYLTRRLAERPANLMFLARAVFGRR